jgi:predicted ArsR family transcriptional regulator
MHRNPGPEVLADRTRLELLRALAEHQEAPLAQLAAAAGVHPNTARPRLEALVRAGVVERVVGQARRRGRPTVRYRIADGWRLPTSDHLGLAELLATLVLRAAISDEQLEAAGRAWGRKFVGRHGSSEPDRAIPLALAQLGFDTRVARKRVALSACPCPLVMPQRPEALCRLATGVLDGTLEAIGSGMRPAAAEHDPKRRSCTVHLRRAGRQHAKDRKKPA